MGTGNAINLLAGGRLYLLPEDRNARLYFNLLVGRNYEQEKLEGLEEQTEWGFGFSAGAYIELSQFVVGLSFDTPRHLILKLGYTF